MERQVTFKTSAFGGFDKKSVLKYIDELCAENQQVVAGLNSKLAEMGGEREKLTTEVQSLNGQVEELRRDAVQSAENSLTLQETITGLKAEMRRQQTLMDEKDRDIRMQQEKCRQLTLRAESLEYKTRKYDEAMSRIGDTFMEAQQSADGILKAAEHKVGQLTHATIESIQGVAEQIGGFKADAAALRATVQNSLSDLGQRLDAIDQSVDALERVVKAAEQYEGPALEFEAVQCEETQAEQPVFEEASTASQEQEEPAQAGAAAPNSEFFW